MIPTVGSPLPSLVVPHVSPEKMKTIALLLRDPNPIHWDVEAVQRLGLADRPVNQGPTNMAYVINMLLAWVGDPSRLHNLHVRFLSTVLAGDRVEAGGVVRSVEDDRDGALVGCDVWLDCGEERALSGTATVGWPA